MADATEDSRLAALGIGGRLEEGAGRELVESAGRLEAGDAPILDAGLHAADMAHAIALVEAGVLPRDVGVRLVELLLELRRVPQAERPADPLLGDAFANREAWLAARDAEAAGWLCAGRARREGTTTAYHMAVRERLLALGDALRIAGSRLVTLAETHVDTLTLDYTYLQQAQPTTLAHYLLGFTYPLLRDLDRLRACYARTNCCPAGVGGINGARWALDRRRIAALLGFDDVVTHARDGMWQADQPVEVMGVVVAALLNLDRLAEDLQVWSTAEFGLVELADRHARGSMVMPQKKNPYALAFVRGTASSMIGRLAAAAMLGRTPSGQVDNRIFAYGDVPRALDLATDTVRLMGAVLGGIAFDRERMARRAAESFAQATDLAEALVTAAGLDYRSAHRVVGRAVGLAVGRGLALDALTPELLDEAARALLDRPLDVDAARVREALDASRAVAGRTGLGGAAPSAVRDMLADCTAKLSSAARWHADASDRLHAAAVTLEATARELTANAHERAPRASLA
jgi:argininosuccinate lyase